MDERRPPKRRASSIMGDDERATIGASRRPQEWPAYVDPEATPPPEPPPSPSSLPGYDTMPPETRRQFDSLGDAVETLTGAVGRLWDARNARSDSERLDKLSAKLDAISSDFAEIKAKFGGLIEPVVRGQKAQIDSIDQRLGDIGKFIAEAKARDEQFDRREWPAIERLMAKLDATCDSIDKRLQSTEHEVEKLAEADEAADERFTEHGAALTLLEQRIDAIERARLEQLAGEKAVTALTTRAAAKRAAIFAGVAAVGGAIGQLISWLVK